MCDASVGKFSILLVQSSSKIRFNSVEMMNDFFELDELLEIEELDALYVERRPYILRERPDHYVNWNDSEFFNRFRFSKATVTEIVNLLQMQLSHPTER